MSQPIAQETTQETTQEVMQAAVSLQFNHVVFVGLGLIGSSLARLLREKNMAQTITAVSRSAYTIDRALTLNIVDQGFTTVAALKALPPIDLVVLAMPVGATEAVLRELKPLLSPRTLITDVGSTKQNVVAAAEHVFGVQQVPQGFVPGHPIAGAEKSGVDAGFSGLFKHHKVILTPLHITATWATQAISALWQAAGAEVICMSAAQHDEILAQTSHLPHLLAFTLVSQLAKSSNNLDVFRYAAGGFRDFTRIAASDPVMWRDIFKHNQTALLAAIEKFEHMLLHYKHMIQQQDSTTLVGELSAAQAARQHFGHMISKTPYMEQHTVTQHYLVSPSTALQGEIVVAGDKSVSHRSIMLGSLAEGTTTVSGFLEGEDALATLQAFRDMGVVIEGPKQGEVTIHGVGLHGLKAPQDALYMGNSGTSMRLLAGILAAQPFHSVMTGDVSLSKRPMERIAKPLRDMGAHIQTTGERGTPPVSIEGGKTLQGICYDLPVASAQVKSGVLLAGLWAQGTTTVVEPEPTRDHTERMLTAFGYPVHVQGNRISLQGGGKLTATHIQVPADISSAAFFMVGAAISQQGSVTLKQVGINPTRTGVIAILQAMGADITLSQQTQLGGEPVADITIRSSRLKGIHIPEDQVPLAIDEFPALFIAAACAEGQTVLTGAAELRVKESDRIQVMADGLKTLGIDCTPTPDGMIINGKGHVAHVFGGGEIETHHDHRIAMSFTMAALRASGLITIRGTENVATSFPNFTELAVKAGIDLNVVS